MSASAAVRFRVDASLRVKVDLSAFLAHTIEKEAVTDKCGIEFKSDPSSADKRTKISALTDGGLGVQAGLTVGLVVLEIGGVQISEDMGASAVADILRSAEGRIAIKTTTAPAAADADAAHDAVAATLEDVELVDAENKADATQVHDRPETKQAPPTEEKAVQPVKLQRSASFGRRMLSRATSFGRRPASSSSSSQDENDGSSTNRSEGGAIRLQRSSSFGRKVQRRSSHTICIERDFRDAPLDFCMSHVRGVGAVITEVVPRSAVERAGLRVGDVLVGVNSASDLTTPSDVAAILARILGTVELRIVRHDEKRNGLPKGWKAAIEPETGRTLFYEVKKSAAVGGNKPFAVGPIKKTRGAGTGIGLQNDDDDREGTSTIVAYVKDHSLFAGKVGVGDEILEVNGVSVKGKARAASRAILEADTITLSVMSKRWCARTTYQNPTVMPAKALAKPRPLREISAQTVQQATRAA